MLACVITVLVHRQLYCITLKILTPRENCSRHLSLLYLQRPLLPLHLATRFTSAFPAAFVFTRSAATVSLSFFSSLSTSILSKPMAGAFNRQWHLSPRAVMSPIHQWGMTGCMSPPSDWGRWGGFTLSWSELWKVCVLYKLTLMVTGSGLLIIDAWCVCLTPLTSTPPQHFLHIPRGCGWGRRRRESRGHPRLSLWRMIHLQALWRPLMRWLMLVVNRKLSRLLFRCLWTLARVESIWDSLSDRY